MNKEGIAAIVSALALIGVIFGAGQRMGAQATEMENQRIQIEKLSEKIDALTNDFNGTRLEIMRLLGSHIDPPARRPR